MTCWSIPAVKASSWFAPKQTSSTGARCSKVLTRVASSAPSTISYRYTFLSHDETSSRFGESGAKTRAEMASFGGRAASNCVALRLLLAKVNSLLRILIRNYLEPLGYSNLGVSCKSRDAVRGAKAEDANAIGAVGVNKGQGNLPFLTAYFFPVPSPTLASSYRHPRSLFDGGATFLLQPAILSRSSEDFRFASQHPAADKISRGVRSQ